MRRPPPRRFFEPSYFAATSLRYQRRIVSGVTMEATSGSVEHTLWYHEVPWFHEPPGFALAIEVAWLPGSLFPEGLQVVLLDEEGFAVLLQEKSHPRGRERRAQFERAGDDGGEIEILDHLQRSPDLLPSAAKIRGVEHVDERALEGRHPYRPVGVGLGDHAAAEVRQPVEGARRANAGELTALEGQRAQVTAGEHREAMPDRVRLAPELQRRVVGDGGVGGELRRKEERIDLERVWVSLPPAPPRRGPGGRAGRCRRQRAG